MTNIGQLRTDKPIDRATAEIRTWLEKLKVDGLSINTNWDARQNVALLRFVYKGQNYEFRSTKQSNSRLNMWAIARVMENKVRNHIMGIEDFGTSMKGYLQLENRSEFQSQEPTQINEKFYVVLGISPTASNSELQERYKYLAKAHHPDTTLTEEGKKEAEKRFIELNEAWAEIKKERGMN